MHRSSPPRAKNPRRYHRLTRPNQRDHRNNYGHNRDKCLQANELHSDPCLLCTGRIEAVYRFNLLECYVHLDSRKMMMKRIQPRINGTGLFGCQWFRPAQTCISLILGEFHTHSSPI